MKPLLVLTVCAAMALSACEGWPLHTITYNPSTPFPSRTPSIRTATPIVLVPSATASSTDTLTPIVTSLTPATSEVTASVTSVASETPTLSDTLTPTGTSAPTVLSANILGCDTSLDITHGMGEVTNAYVTISNATAADVNDLCATLSGLDEGRPHPDKTKCVPSLASGYQVTLKLTVDSTYKAQTPIQIDFNSGGTLLLRVGAASCTAIGVLVPAPGELGVPMPIP